MGNECFGKRMEIRDYIRRALRPVNHNMRSLEGRRMRLLAERRRNEEAITRATRERRSRQEVRLLAEQLAMCDQQMSMLGASLIKINTTKQTIEAAETKTEVALALRDFTRALAIYDRRMSLQAVHNILKEFETQRDNMANKDEVIQEAFDDTFEAELESAADGRGDDADALATQVDFYLRQAEDEMRLDLDASMPSLPDRQPLLGRGERDEDA